MTAKIKSPHQTSTRHKHKPKGTSSKSFEKVYWPYIPLLLFMGLVLVLASQSGVLASMIKHPSGNVLAYATSISPTELLADTNTDRSASGAKPLKTNVALSQAAQAKANDMASHNYWSHSTPAGNPPWVFVEAQNYTYQKIGENLAAGFSDSQATINGWMASPEHKENMLDPAFSDVGFGFANNPNYTSTGNNGPMTIVVAFYGEPEAGININAASAITPNQSTDTAQPGASQLGLNSSATSRAQLAFAHSPVARYSTWLAIICLTAVISVWFSRHLLTLRRMAVSGESFVVSHPLFDVGLLLLGFAFYALTQTAGLIR
jgi:uncharacterized protein YkwD